MNTLNWKRPTEPHYAIAAECDTQAGLARHHSDLAEWEAKHMPGCDGEEDPPQETDA